MLEIRRDEEIHAEDGGWFRARWHFSFDRYRDPEQRGIGPLRVFNDDRLVAGADWPMHPHADVEGITYVVEGTFEHADSLGGDGRLEPGLEQRQFTLEDRRNRLRQVVGSEGGDVVTVHQDATVHVAALDPGVEAEHAFGDDRGGYLYVVGGAARLGGERLSTGDAAKIAGPERVGIHADAPTELILIDVPNVYTPPVSTLYSPSDGSGLAATLVRYAPVAESLTPRSVTTPVSSFASSGHRFRQTGSMKETIVTRPRSPAVVSARPLWSRSLNAGAGRAPAAQPAYGAPAAGAPEPWVERTAAATPMPAPTTAVAANNSTRIRPLTSCRR